MTSSSAYESSTPDDLHAYSDLNLPNDPVIINPDYIDSYEEPEPPGPGPE